jgi:hypothetical protein
MAPSEEDHDTTELSESLDKIKRRKQPWDSLKGGNDTPDGAPANPPPASQPPPHAPVSVNDNARD